MVLGTIGLEAQNFGIRSGYWEVSESYQNETGEHSALWSFEMVDDGSPTIVAVGERKQTNGKTTRDRSVALLFIDKLGGGRYSGSYIEAYGDGEQIELSVDVELLENGQVLEMAAKNQEGVLVTNLVGTWIGEGMGGALKSGNWLIREIVSPGKGGADIQWSHELSEDAGTISGRGNQMIVNGRLADQDEKNTYSDFRLQRSARNRNVVLGQGSETNHLGERKSLNYEGWISPTGRTLFVMSYDSEGLDSLIVGRFSGN